jgi:hypothetical protein
MHFRLASNRTGDEREFDRHLSELLRIWRAVGPLQLEFVVYNQWVPSFKPRILMFVKDSSVVNQLRNIVLFPVKL